MSSGPLVHAEAPTALLLERPSGPPDRDGSPRDPSETSLDVVRHRGPWGGMTPQGPGDTVRPSVSEGAGAAVRGRTTLVLKVDTGYSFLRGPTVPGDVSHRPSQSVTSRKGCGLSSSGRRRLPDPSVDIVPDSTGLSPGRIWCLPESP